MATLVAKMATSGISPRAIHAGVQSVIAVYSLTATLSAGDIIQMCKLPDGARVIGVLLGTNVNPFASAGVVEVGDSGDTDRFIQSATLSANILFTIGRATGIGPILDISDDATTRYTTIDIKVTTFDGTGTKSGTISLIVQYQVDQPDVS